jgi:hypothetical protein
VRAALIVAGVIVVLIVGVLTAFLVHGALADTSGASTQDRVEAVVEQINNEVQFPTAIDSITTWTGVEAGENAVHFTYTISADVDPSTVTTDDIRNSVLPNVCAATDTSDALDAGVTLEYTYAFEGTDKILDFAITPTDCS